jgi:ribosomal-protein-alanine acetyltransferase
MAVRDLTRVASVERVCFGAEAWPRPVFKELLQVFGNSQPTRGGLWVAEDASTGEVLGYVGIEVSGLGGEVDIINVAVDPAQRRRGVGGALVSWVVRICRRRGVPLLWLRVRASNRSARRFYQRMGFQQRGSFSGYYQDPNEPAILMAMDLEG